MKLKTDFTRTGADETASLIAARSVTIFATGQSAVSGSVNTTRNTFNAPHATERSAALRLSRKLRLARKLRLLRKKTDQDSTPSSRRAS